MDPKWRWHMLVYHFIKELNMTEESVYKMNYISSLNWQAFFMEKSKVEQALIKKK